MLVSFVRIDLDVIKKLNKLSFYERIWWAALSVKKL
mgnify:CR=1 FL=1